MLSTVKAPQFGIKEKLAVDESLFINPPTTRYRDQQGWLICNSSLGCGSRILQGWSAGIGIDSANQNEFEKRFFELLYLSANTAYIKDKWEAYNTGKSTEAPIGVGLNRYQYLYKDYTYTLNSTAPWIDRFEAFVTKHNLGQFTKSHVWNNPGYRREGNVTAVWTWNGNVPKSADVGITDWKLPENEQSA